MAALDDGGTPTGASSSSFATYYHNSGAAGGEWRPFSDEQCRIIDKVKAPYVLISPSLPSFLSSSPLRSSRAAPTAPHLPYRPRPSTPSARPHPSNAQIPPPASGVEG